MSLYLSMCTEVSLQQLKLYSSPLKCSFSQFNNFLGSRLPLPSQEKNAHLQKLKCLLFLIKRPTLPRVLPVSSPSIDLQGRLRQHSQINKDTFMINILHIKAVIFISRSICNHTHTHTNTKKTDTLMQLLRQRLVVQLDTCKERNSYLLKNSRDPFSYFSNLPLLLCLFLLNNQCMSSIHPLNLFTHFSSPSPLYLHIQILFFKSSMRQI